MWPTGSLFKSRHPGWPADPLIVDGKLGDLYRPVSPTLKFKLDAEGQTTNEAIEAVGRRRREEGDGEPRALAKEVCGRLGILIGSLCCSERGAASKREGRC